MFLKFQKYFCIFYLYTYMCVYVHAYALSGTCRVHWMTSRQTPAVLALLPRTSGTVSTLGSRSLEITGGRYIVLSPFAISPSLWKMGESDYRWLYVFQVSPGFSGRGRTT